MKTLFFSGRNSLTCDDAEKKNEHQIFPDITAAAESKKKIEFLVSMKNEDERSQAAPETGEIKHIDDCKSFAAAKLLQTKKHLVKLSEKPKHCPALKSVRDSDCKSLSTKFPLKKKQLKKKQQLPLKMSEKHQPLKKNLTETLELFEIAKISADKANAKGILASEAETSICVDTLSLLICFPISSTATETRRIMVRLEHLTKHKNRKICNSASALLHHWRQSIRDQERLTSS